MRLNRRDLLKKMGIGAAAIALPLPDVRPAPEPEHFAVTGPSMHVGPEPWGLPDTDEFPTWHDAWRTGTIVTATNTLTMSTYMFQGSLSPVYITEEFKGTLVQPPGWDED